MLAVTGTRARRWRPFQSPRPRTFCHQEGIGGDLIGGQIISCSAPRLPPGGLPWKSAW